MKGSIKNRIAAALLLASSLGGHNYKTAAVDHVKSRKFKNNKQSASFPLLAKIGIPVGSLALLVGGGYYFTQRKKAKYKFEQDEYKLSEESLQKNENIRMQNFEFMKKTAGSDEQRKALIEAFEKIAKNLKGLTYAAAEEKLFIKCKYFSFSDFVNEKKATFKKNSIEKSPEKLYIGGKQYQPYKQAEKINLKSLTEFRANVVKTGFSTLLGAICGHRKIDDQDFEINDNYINFFEDKHLVMAKCSLNISKGLLTIRCEHKDNEQKIMAKVISIFDVSEWIK